MIEMYNNTFRQFERCWLGNAQLALDTIDLKPVKGVPTWVVNDMQWSQLDEISGNPSGSYEKEPARVYREFQLAAGCCMIDQWIPENHCIAAKPPQPIILQSPLYCG